MRIGVVILAHNSTPDIERLALSLHCQTYTDWVAYVVDVNSTDKLSDITWPWNKQRDCGLLTERFKPEPIQTYDYSKIPPERRNEMPPQDTAWIDAWDRVMRDTPMCQLFAFLPANTRLNMRTLETVYNFFRPGVDIATVQLESWRKDRMPHTAYFYRRTVLENHPPYLALSVFGEFVARVSTPHPITPVGHMSTGHYFPRTERS